MHRFDVLHDFVAFNRFFILNKPDIFAIADIVNLQVGRERPGFIALFVCQTDIYARIGGQPVRIDIRRIELEIEKVEIRRCINEIGRTGRGDRRKPAAAGDTFSAPLKQPPRTRGARRPASGRAPFRSPTRIPPFQ